MGWAAGMKVLWLLWPGARTTGGALLTTPNRLMPESLRCNGVAETERLLSGAAAAAQAESPSAEGGAPPAAGVEVPPAPGSIDPAGGMAPL